jgi:hypothetical protein
VEIKLREYVLQYCRQSLRGSDDLLACNKCMEHSEILHRTDVSMRDDFTSEKSLYVGSRYLAVNDHSGAQFPIFNFVTTIE